MTPEALVVAHDLGIRVKVSEDAARHVARRGGSLYLWVSKAGLLHVRTKAPADTADWQRERRSGIDLVFAPSINGASDWRIELRGFPRRRIDAISNLEHDHTAWRR